MTRRFNAHFANGVIVPDEKVELPYNTALTVTVEESSVASPVRNFPRVDDPSDPMPKGGAELIDWWRRHALPIDPVIGERIAQAKEYAHYEEPDDDA
jgi:hypothetical protein